MNTEKLKNKHLKSQRIEIMNKSIISKYTEEFVNAIVPFGTKIAVLE